MMYKRGNTFNLSTLVALVLSACAPLATDQDAMPTQRDGAMFFSANCASCHSPDGRGADASTAGLSAVPPDLTRLSAGNGGDFPAARALSYIYGTPDNSHLARVMPEFGPVMADDLVPVDIDGVLTPTPRELAGLLVYLESIQQ